MTPSGHRQERIDQLLRAPAQQQIKHPNFAVDCLAQGSITLQASHISRAPRAPQVMTVLFCLYLTLSSAWEVESIRCGVKAHAQFGSIGFTPREAIARPSLLSLPLIFWLSFG
jgi:hypothetical protein